MIDMLVRDEKLFSLKEILSDDEDYCDTFMDYLWKINYIDKI